MDVTLVVNGEAMTVRIPSNRTLLDVLREDLDLTGAKRGCNQGVCGACNVLLDGQPARACLTLAADAVDVPITTVEGLADGNALSIVQQAFLDAAAIQCGFCMTGMIVTAAAFLAMHPKPTRDEIRQAIAGNLCRCSGYVKVIDAIELASRRMTT
jgi:aerobic carbon-monoxide dehydrogenase small subunit